MPDHTAAVLCPPSLFLFLSLSRSLSLFISLSLSRSGDPTLSMEPNSPKKIQFAVPLFQSHLDPQAAEHIRKRRPTPATLVIYNDPSASDDKQSSSSSQAENQSAQLSPAQRKTSVYTPPTMRELQLVVEQHFQRQELEAGHSDSPDTPSPITAQHYGNAAQWANHNCPEPNGNEGYVSSDAQAGSSEAGGESPESSECRQKNLSSPSSISR
ncbi:protein phosphatase 1 regulatory subunit 1C isoform X2 [Astyanax mexicanus]|uniref:protein phosphatase 1 regulatory subunit 1C isoform X2 n=1 Tax=Astyanax mexicanus TaxID=7994 RepID=UPI0020CAD5D1|nr:protein phosphatase 1 regulatory subunit 1C isoform X2 [Astyanax mexicanus]